MANTTEIIEMLRVLDSTCKPESIEWVAKIAADKIEELRITTSAQKETIEELRARNSAQADMLDGEWISVEERLPEKHQAVLFYIPWNKTNMIGWIDEGGGINLEGYGKCYAFSLIKPSHWMPLPKAPEEVK